MAEQDRQRRSPVLSVVVGVDGSGVALRAVRWAVAEADRRHAPLQIVHAALYALGSASGALRAASVLAVACTVAAQERPGVATYTEYVTERTTHVLRDAAKAAQLLVVGMEGRTGLDDAVLLHACTSAACPVVVVRGRPGPHPAGRPVVVGIEDVGRDAAAITAAFADADRTGTTLVVIHALQGPEAVLDAVAGHPASGRAEAEQEIAHTLLPWQSRYPGVPIDVRVVHGSPGAALLEAAVTARLVVVGSHGRGAGLRLVLGSTSHSVARHCPCPIMVVRRDVRVVEPE